MRKQVTIPAKAPPNWAVRLLPIALISLPLMTALPNPARAAADTVTTRAVWLRAGPSVAYPYVTSLRGRTPVTVHGCLADWSWCDVSFPQARGWVAKSYLSVPDRGWQRPIPGSGPRGGVPVVSFAFDDYWGRYYRDRPWYRDRARWARVPPPPHYAPPHHGRPPAHPPRPPQQGPRATELPAGE